MPSTVLIIDDDQKLSQLLARYLAQHQLVVHTEATPESGLARLKELHPDLLILDIMLPGRTGFEVCRDIRQFSPVPIIMLTARNEVTDRVVGLELGADDYVLKPVDPRELLARITTVLRRIRPPVNESSVLEFPGLRIDTRSRTVFLDGEELKVSTMEFDVLCLFARQAGKVLTRDEVLNSLRGIEWESFNRSIDVFISRLRQKLNDDPKRPRFFKTVWGSGYLFMDNSEPGKKAS